jgi:hypothetical protein
MRGGTEENHECLQSAEPISRPEFQQGTSRIADERLNAAVNLQFASILRLHATLETSIIQKYHLLGYDAV